jgi:hypothetical protein
MERKLRKMARKMAVGDAVSKARDYVETLGKTSVEAKEVSRIDLAHICDPEPIIGYAKVMPTTTTKPELMEFAPEICEFEYELRTTFILQDQGFKGDYFGRYFGCESHLGLMRNEVLVSRGRSCLPKAKFRSKRSTF